MVMEIVMAMAMAMSMAMVMVMGMGMGMGMVMGIVMVMVAVMMVIAMMLVVANGRDSVLEVCLGIPHLHIFAATVHWSHKKSQQHHPRRSR